MTTPSQSIGQSNRRSCQAETETIPTTRGRTQYEGVWILGGALSPNPCPDSNRFQVMATQPLVTVGIPVFNAARTLDAALRGISEQSHSNLEVLVSNNASTDDTSEIVSRHTKLDSRFKAIDRERNRGAQNNFGFVLAIARGEFFMWAGSDDQHHPRFVELNLERLLTDPSVSGSVSQVRWLYDGAPDGLAAGTVPLLAAPRENLATLMRSARDNSRFYGLFRTEALRASFPESEFPGFDIAVMAGTLRFGGHDRVDQVLLSRERRDPSQYASALPADANALDRLLPMGRLTAHILREDRELLSAAALSWLAARNIHEHFRFWASMAGAYGGLARQVHGRLDWIRRKLWAADRSDPS